MEETILIVDDEIGILNVLRFALSAEGYNVSTASNGREALNILEAGGIDLLLTDIRMPVMDGLALIENLKHERIDVEVIVLTGHASLEIVLDVFKKGGVFDFFQKPLDDIDHMIMAINKAMEVRRLKKDRERMRRELEAGERFSRAVIDTLPSHLLILNRNGTILNANRAWEQFIEKHADVPPGSMIGKNFLSSCAFEMKNDESRRIQSGIQSLLSGETDQFETKFQCPLSDVEKWFFMQACRLSDERNTIVVSQMDITLLKTLEKELIDARKMEALTTLSGGVAHLFNNALSAMLGAAELLELQAENDYSRKLVSMIITSGRKMENYTKQLISYTESGFFENDTILLNDLIDSTLTLIDNILETPSHVSTDLSGEVRHVWGDAAMLQTVIYEILSNAVEATEGVGKASISTRKIRVDIPPPGSTSKTAGDYFVISIKDDGIGIEDEIKPRIFDPFFTTKFVGRGLGLPAAYGIVRSHGGWIQVDSRVDEGTEIQVFLPVYIESEIKANMKPDDAKEPEKTVLIIEDNPLNLQFAEAIFETLGFKILKATDGAQAFDIIDSYEGNISLTLLDMVLPDMGGEEIYPEIEARRPDMNFIVCSGYSSRNAWDNLRSMGTFEFIQKPVDLKKLKLILNQWFDLE